METLFEIPVPKISKKVVCPICFSKCALFKRLQKSKFAPEEIREAMRKGHRSVCERCKRLLQPSGKCKARQKWNKDMERWVQVRCEDSPPKTLDNKELPSWWTDV